MFNLQMFTFGCGLVLSLSHMHILPFAHALHVHFHAPARLLGSLGGLWALLGDSSGLFGASEGPNRPQEVPGRSQEAPGSPQASPKDAQEGGKEPKVAFRKIKRESQIKKIVSKAKKRTCEV